MKTKVPRAEAVAVAKELCDGLKPWCEELIVAGSLRRRKEMVGDVELVFVPKVSLVAVDFCKAENVSQRWLATGLGAEHPFRQIAYSSGIDSFDFAGVSFSYAYQFLRRPAVPHCCGRGRPQSVLNK